MNVGGIPSCALQCFKNPSNNLCLEYTKNCVCTNGKPSCDGAASSCNATELEEYDSWFTGECLYNITTTSTPTVSTAPGTSITTITSVSPTSKTASSLSSTSMATGGPAQSGGSTPKGAIVGASLGGFAVTMIIGAIVYFSCLRPRTSDPQATIGSISQEQSNNLDGNNPVRRISELMGSTMIPIEVPAGPYGPIEVPAVSYFPPVCEKG